MYDMILVRFGEMTLKKDNYKFFLNRMVQNIEKKLSIFPRIKCTHTAYRFYIHLNGEDEQQVISQLQTIVGIYSFSCCKKTTSDLDDIAKTAIECLEDQKDRLPFTFKVETHRANKSYPLTSQEISQEIAKRVLPNVHGLSVDVHHPEVMLAIDLRNEGTYIYTQVIKGLGGYPSGMAGSGLLLISGGIDSPVAGYCAIRKGLKIEAIHYASPPYTSDDALQKVIQLMERLAEYTSDGEIILHVVPFTDIQLRIKEKSSTNYLMTIMRRTMMKIADAFARTHHIDCLVNGESIGQVASQTIESMKVVNEVTNLPVIRPLVTYDKEEIVLLAKSIKTYETSIVPYEDCCTIFVPTHPATKPRLEAVIKEEEACELEPLIEEALAHIETYSLSNKEKTRVHPYRLYEI